MPKADKKQRHKAKREMKRLEARRRSSVSPVKRLAQAAGEVECWTSDDFESFGQMQLFVYKQAAGMAGVAGFLIDRGVTGLKDAWVKMNVDREEFNRMLGACDRNGIPMRRASLDHVRRWVAGGLRWAHENGMRLPKDWARAASLINGVDDWASADVSAFVKEFAGHPQDLRQRVIGESFDSYVQRTDINFVWSDTAPYLNHETGRYVDANARFESGDDPADEPESIAADVPVEQLNAFADRFTPAATALAAETGNWLATRGELASPELIEGWRSVMVAAMLSKAATPDGTDEELADVGYELLEDLARRIEQSRVAEHRRAVVQVLAHLETDTLMMQKAVLRYGLAD